jgi:1-acyl-sn-glycerol-3-phosphate acyltransferase
VANHNSHLDTVVLMTLVPPRLLARLRPVAAADYFLRNRFVAWFALNVMHILPIRRGAAGRADPLADLSEALDAGDILILFPEGTRGEPERLGAFKSRALGVPFAGRLSLDVRPWASYSVHAWTPTLFVVQRARPKPSRVVVTCNGPRDDHRHPIVVVVLRGNRQNRTRELSGDETEEIVRLA